jgi:hypothetical protein
MNKTLLVVLISLIFQRSLCAETLYGLELASAPMREKHLDHLMKLFHEFCLGKKSQQVATQNIINSDRFRPAKDFEGTYEEYFKGLSYAVTPDQDSCTVDVLLQYQPGILLLSLNEIQIAITQLTNFSHAQSLRKAEIGDNSESIQTIESHYLKNGTNANKIVLTYPTSYQDIFYMTINYYYE